MNLKLITLAVVSTGAFAAFNADIDVNIGDVYKCQQRVKKQRIKIQDLKDDLFQCQTNGSGNANLRKKILILKNEIQDLNDENSFLENENSGLNNSVSYLSQRVNDLEVENEKLRRRLSPPTDNFNLARSMAACGEISNDHYKRACISSARQYKIKAKVIKGCTQLNNEFYVADCVESAGKFGLNGKQTAACGTIGNAFYGASCAKVAGERSVPASVIRACNSSNGNDFYKVECLK